MVVFYLLRVTLLFQQTMPSIFRDVMREGVSGG